MTISHRELMSLARLPEQFPIIGSYMRGASVDVTFDPGGGFWARTHLIVDSREFPLVFIAVEGSAGRPGDHYFFTPISTYCRLSWELADPEDEALIRELIAGKQEENAESVQAEMDRRAAARNEAARELAGLRTAEHMADARERLRVGHGDPAAQFDWDSVLKDLTLLIRTVEREVDRSFIIDLADKRRRFQVPFTERRVAWLSAVRMRTAGRLAENTR